MALAKDSEAALIQGTTETGVGTSTTGPVGGKGDWLSSEYNRDKWGSQPRSRVCVWSGGGLDMTGSKHQGQGHPERDGLSRILAEGKLR